MLRMVCCTTQIPAYLTKLSVPSFFAMENMVILIVIVIPPEQYRLLTALSCASPKLAISWENPIAFPIDLQQFGQIRMITRSRFDSESVNLNFILRSFTAI